MYIANMFDFEKGIWRMTAFRSLSLLLERAKRDERHRLTVYNGTEEMKADYDPKHGWRISKANNKE
jgi:hypothetical protein